MSSGIFLENKLNATNESIEDATLQLSVEHMQLLNMYNCKLTTEAWFEEGEKYLFAFLHSKFYYKYVMNEQS